MFNSWSTWEGCLDIFIVRDLSRERSAIVKANIKSDSSVCDDVHALWQTKRRLQGQLSVTSIQAALTRSHWPPLRPPACLQPNHSVRWPLIPVPIRTSIFWWSMARCENCILWSKHGIRKCLWDKHNKKHTPNRDKEENNRPLWSWCVWMYFVCSYTCRMSVNMHSGQLSNHNSSFVTIWWRHPNLKTAYLHI